MSPRFKPPARFVSSLPSVMDNPPTTPHWCISSFSWPETLGNVRIRTLDLAPGRIYCLSQTEPSANGKGASLERVDYNRRAVADENADENNEGDSRRGNGLEAGNQLSRAYWIALPTDENTLLALEPISRIVPTTITRITANITAYSATSCPCSSRHTLCNHFAIAALLGTTVRPFWVLCPHAAVACRHSNSECKSFTRVNSECQTANSPNVESHSTKVLAPLADGLDR